MKKITMLLSLAVTLVGTTSYASSFWGINIGTADYGGLTNLTFDGVAQSGAQYVVGGYMYTCVDGVWEGPFAPASPGAGYRASYNSDAQGMFFMSNQNYAKFVIVTGSSQDGALATECGYDKRQFGPGDLKIDVAGKTYGIGLRKDNLLWAEDPNTTSSYYQIINPDNTVNNIYSRDKGTLNDIELDPEWARVGNAELSAGSDAATAFYISGSGASVGSADVTFNTTDVILNSTHVYTYEISVPWQTLGIDASNGFNIDASWRPDCGNDLIEANFKGVPNTVPEPGSILCLMSGIIGLGIIKRLKN